MVKDEEKWKYILHVGNIACIEVLWQEYIYGVDKKKKKRNMLEEQRFKWCDSCSGKGFRDAGKCLFILRTIGSTKWS